MKKKVISAALAGTLAVSLLSACGASNEPQNISDVSSAASSEATSTTASSESTGDAAQELTFTENGVNNPLKHIRGALSMARDDDFDTAGTQFFVVHKDAAKLDGRYAAFGEMESGFDVLDAIANQPTYGPETWNKPKQMPVITKITIED